MDAVLGNVGKDTILILGRQGIPFSLQDFNIPHWFPIHTPDCLKRIVRQTRVTDDKSVSVIIIIVSLIIMLIVIITIIIIMACVRMRWHAIACGRQAESAQNRRKIIKS